MRKPVGIIYGVNDVPPIGVTLLSGLQHVGIITAAYLSPSLLAVKTGGLSLVLGMTAFGGLVEVALSRALHRLRPYFPSGISGFVVLMIGVAVGSLGLRNVLALGTAEPASGLHLTVATILFHFDH